MDLVCLDDLQSISQLDSWEQAIFNLYNLLKDKPNSLIISGKRSSRKFKRFRRRCFTLKQRRSVSP
jgi:chromosomal replication initiation ATPase DnaA